MRYAYPTLLAVLVAGAIWLLADRDSADDTPLNAANTGESTATDGAVVKTMSDGAGIKEGHPPVTSASAAPPAGAPIDQHLASRLAAMHQRGQGRTYRADEVAAVVARDVAWVPASGTPTSLPLKPEEFVDGRQFIRLDPLKIESLMQGDSFTVVLDGKPYRVEIDSVEPHGSGRTSWHGHLAGLGERYSVTFTRGESLTVGGLDTPAGHYALQAHGKDGWVATSELLFKRNPNETDAILPPMDQLGH